MNKSQIIQTIVADMQIKKDHQNAAHEAAYYKALANNPKLAAANRQISELTSQVGKAAAKGQNTSALEAQLTKATAARDKLREAILPAPPQKAGCKKCGDTGYYQNKLCRCVMEKCSQILAQTNGLDLKAPKSFNANMSEVFKDKKTQDEMKKIYALLSKYCEKFPIVKTPNIVLSGGTGTGKTFASQVVAANLFDRGFNVMYLTAFSLIQRFKDFIFNFEHTQKLDDLFECDFLVIDDLGTEPVIKNITQEYLYNVINERLTSGKAFLITTNLNPDAIVARYDQRLASRILSKQTTALIEMKGNDLRLG